ncbi:MAG: hypothetical protein QF535_01800, partial [Anaerolineales bacterium]|nr:hypothetical protein [Anaerolineales bacterium]
TRCGDGIIQVPNGEFLAEECDDGSDNANSCVAPRGGSCSFCRVGFCDERTLQGSFCGDGTFDVGDEQCTNPNAANFCVADCNQNIAPVITILSPDPGENLAFGQIFTIQANVIDRDRERNVVNFQLKRVNIIVMFENVVVAQTSTTDVIGRDLYTFDFVPEKTGSYTVQVEAIDSVVTSRSVGVRSEIDATIQIKTIKEIGLAPGGLATYTLADESVQITDPPDKPSLTSRIVSWLRGLVGFAVRTSVVADADQSKIVNNGGPFKAYLQYQIVDSGSLAVLTVGPRLIEVSRVEKLDVLFDVVNDQVSSQLFGWDPFDRDLAISSVGDIFGLYQLRVQLQDKDGTVLRNSAGNILNAVSNFRIVEQCGDERVTGTEVCDTTDFNGKVCGDFLNTGGGAFTGGTLSCLNACSDIGTDSCVTVAGCFNKLQDGAPLFETDVDCGGPVSNGCPRCGLTQTCTDDFNCDTGLICDGGVCT